MQKVLSRCNKYIQRISKLFDVYQNITGKFKLLFVPASNIPDSDGNSIIDTYLIPIDQEAQKAVANKKKEPFLHLQILGDSLPADFLGYEFFVHAEAPDKKRSQSPEKEYFVYDIQWLDRDQTKQLFQTLNTNH